MQNLGASLGWGLVVGGSLVAGALLAAFKELPARIAANLTAFGGGILLAAVALELVPEADEQAGAGLTAAFLLVGTLLYVGADAWLTRDEMMSAVRRSGHSAAAGRAMALPPAHAEAARGEPITAGLFVDGVPESIALGLTIARGELGLALLAGIVVGNAVEAYGADQPIIAGGHAKSFAVRLLSLIGAALAVATLLGGTLLAAVSPAVIGSAEALAAGAVLAVISVSIIPHAFSEVSSEVATASVVGFIAGYLLG